ncbi:MAG: hypothetical protein RL585_2177 [Pseudomonadota bacterium]
MHHESLWSMATKMKLLESCTVDPMHSRVCTANDQGVDQAVRQTSRVDEHGPRRS